MVNALLFDFARVLLFPTDKNYSGGVNDLHKKVSQNPDFKFFDYFVLNKELMNYLFSIKHKVPIYMFTSETIQNSTEIRDGVSKVFSKIFSAKEMGKSKTNPDTYRFIAGELNLDPSEILFVDDNSKNIEAANLAGLKTIRYTDNGVIKKMNSLI